MVALLDEVALPVEGVRPVVAGAAKVAVAAVDSFLEIVVAAAVEDFVLFVAVQVAAAAADLVLLLVALAAPFPADTTEAETVSVVEVPDGALDVVVVAGTAEQVLVP